MLVSDRSLRGAKSRFLLGDSLGKNVRHAWRRTGNVHVRKRREGWRAFEVSACRDCERKTMLFLRKQGVSMGAGVDLLKMVSETRALKGEGGKSVGDWDPLDVGGSSAGKTNQEKTDLENKAEKEEKEEEELQEESRGVGLALSLLKFYKGNISPLLPPSCRYLPTCSEYAMDSFKEFGFAKGGVLTAWRLARCNPLGGSGYDPPKWPPPGLEWLIEFLEKKYAGESVLAISCILAAIFAVQRTHPF